MFKWLNKTNKHFIKVSKTLNTSSFYFYIMTGNSRVMGDRETVSLESYNAKGECFWK